MPPTLLHACMVLPGSARSSGSPRLCCGTHSTEPPPPCPRAAPGCSGSDPRPAAGMPAPSLPLPQVGLDGVGRSHGCHEANGVGQAEGDVLRGPGEEQQQGQSCGVRRAEPHTPGRMGSCTHRFRTTTTTAPSGRWKAVYSSSVFLDCLEATSPTRWEPSGMNLLHGHQKRVRP